MKQKKAGVFVGHFMQLFLNLDYSFQLLLSRFYGALFFKNVFKVVLSSLNEEKIVQPQLFLSDSPSTVLTAALQMLHYLRTKIH